MLWDDRKKRKEDSAQILLTMLFDGFCEMKRIDYSREVDTGRGCVDFKISSGEYKYLIEVKNKMGMIIKIIDDQLGLYMKAEKVNYGMLIVFIYTDEEYFHYKKIFQGYKKIDKTISLEYIDARLGKRTGSKKG